MEQLILIFMRYKDLESLKNQRFFGLENSKNIKISYVIKQKLKSSKLKL